MVNAKRLKRIILVLTIALAGFVLWRSVFKQESLEVGSHSVILYGEAARPLFDQCSRSSPAQVEGFWPPTAQDIQQLESILPRFLAAQHLRDGAPLNLRRTQSLNYYKQYAGFLRNGRKMIYLNASSEISTTWLQEATIVCDGGEAFFGVEYDVESGQWSDFQFNGAV